MRKFNLKLSSATPESLEKLRSHPGNVTDRMDKSGLTILPKSCDLRKHMPEIFDQDILGSCTAQALAAAVYYDQARRGIEPIVMPSRLFIYYNEREMENSVMEDSGASLSDGILSLVSYGACSEGLWPYEIDKFTIRPPEFCYRDAMNCIDVDGCQHAAVTQDLLSIKRTLASGIPIVLGIAMHESLLSPIVSTSGIIPMPRRKEEVLGYHAVMLVGYNDLTQTFLLRNSWGVNWGNRGYASIPYNYIIKPHLALDLWTVTGIGAKMSVVIEKKVEEVVVEKKVEEVVVEKKVEEVVVEKKVEEVVVEKKSTDPTMNRSITLTDYFMIGLAVVFVLVLLYLIMRPKTNTGQ